MRESKVISGCLMVHGVGAPNPPIYLIICFKYNYVIVIPFVLTALYIVYLLSLKNIPELDHGQSHNKLREFTKQKWFTYFLISCFCLFLLPFTFFLCMNYTLTSLFFSYFTLIGFHFPFPPKSYPFISPKEFY